MGYIIFSYNNGKEKNLTTFKKKVIIYIYNKGGS